MAGQLKKHPVLRLFLVRAGLGLITLLAVSVIVFVATEVLPGNAAVAALGHAAPHKKIERVASELHLDEPIYSQYWQWIKGVVHGDFGKSFVNGESVTSYVAPMLLNSAVLVLVTTVLAIVIGVLFGAAGALWRDRPIDHVMSVTALAASALPEFVVGIFMVLLFSVGVFHFFPAVSIIPPGEHVWQHMNLIVLPVATLLIVVVPYIFRMTRATTIEALESEYVEVSELKGASRSRVLLRDALPNALPPIVQVIGLNILFLSGGVVLVEVVFNFPGIGQGLVNAVDDRDIPTIQFIVLVLALVYVVVNILTDVIALLFSPRRRLAS